MSISTVPLQERHAVDGRAGAEAEVRQRRRAAALRTAVARERLARKEAGLPGQRQADEGVVGQGFVELFDPPEPDRDLGAKDGVDAQLRRGRAVVEAFPLGAAARALLDWLAG